MQWRNAIKAIALVLTAGMSAELAARVDDWVRYDTPLWHTPDEAVDLRVSDSLGVHGRPYGRYRQWSLNNFGFRGPDMSQKPPVGCTRLLVLGASETMGYYEAPGKEYPAQLRDSLALRGCYEVVNAGVPGMSLKGITRFWNSYASRFGAQLVLVYVSPLSYLNDNLRATPARPAAASPQEPRVPWRPRLLERLHNHTPDFVQRRRIEVWIARDTVGKPASWFFNTPPEDRMSEYVQDLDSLVASIKAAGATPVLMTHAIRDSVARPENGFLLLAWHQYQPRATVETMLLFERQGAVRLREFAAAHHVQVVDVDRTMTGRSQLFADMVHFTSDGAGRVAGVIARTLTQSGSVRVSGRN